ncbi:MAG: Dam family site-specific DNA-(adenine-N6)-methyltransferase [Synechococcus sp.]|nr:Dam family site-specific DNA-(adenine-N6)-methyltransferase [Synechococcus sp.]
MTDPKQLKPPLKWAGGKRWLVPKLRLVWQDYQDYQLVEPFCGGLAIALGLSPQRAILNDINPHVINFYRHLKKGLAIELKMANNQGLYYQCRERFNQLVYDGKEATPEAAILFYYLNHTGFNGLCRFNSKGMFNVPFGRYKKINYCTDFSAYKTAFQHWDFQWGDFEEITVDDRSFIYADPPYDVEFRQYSAGGFRWEDQERLALWLAAQKAPVIASNQATERILKLYQKLGFSIQTLPAPRRIACNGDRTPALEMLALRGCLKRVWQAEKKRFSL